ncbi:hypothetical protein D3C81_714350 [compost metagenome]
MLNPFQATVAQPAQRQRISLEQALEAFHGRHQRQVVRHATTLEAAQYALIRQSLTAFIGMQQFFGQYRGIEKAQVDPLPGQRVNGVRRVADQRQAFGYIAFGMTLAQRHAKP